MLCLFLLHAVMLFLHFVACVLHARSLNSRVLSFAERPPFQYLSDLNE